MEVSTHGRCVVIDGVAHTPSAARACAHALFDAAEQITPTFGGRDCRLLDVIERKSSRVEIYERTGSFVGASIVHRRDGFVQRRVDLHVHELRRIARWLSRLAADG